MMKPIHNMSDSKNEMTGLFEKYCADTCNREEFDKMIDLVGDGEHDRSLYALLKQIWDANALRSPRKVTFRWAAAAAIGLLLITTTFLLWKSGEEAPQPMVQHEAGNTLSGATRIQLPDGSTVTLRDGGWLNMDGSFEGDRREVSLQGEAYFDVAPNPYKPFVIHTGSVKTTVLGTAFSIKADPAEEMITITVTRGKVRVEDEHTVLATLEADKQLVYNTKTNRLTEKTIDAGVETEWRSHHLVYRNSTFEQIVQEIAMLYEVTIRFEEDALRERQITASLDDRDGVETILDMLCTAQRAYWTEEGGSYVIRSLGE